MRSEHSQRLLKLTQKSVGPFRLRSILHSVSPDLAQSLPELAQLFDKLVLNFRCEKPSAAG